MSSSSPPLVIPAHHFFLRRCAAYLVDILLLFVILFPLGWVVVLAVGFSPGSGIQVWQATLINFSIPAWSYSTWLRRSAPVAIAVSMIGSLVRR